ncbi:hypothetical protein [Extibacter muris]|uniref:hypothetical protein n=1 Tax=Extibacter muris TaxID=1796622 RepID=UPI001D083662|nr:hypothetical protein [Extibacter muris]MCB6202027.1 hypothetical protein [Extibacter muris]MCQ4663301.1 hypothetical protein [Extibacter muris]MCQ4692659.1 hypothetical protein [Extibacter muris]
MTDIIKSEPVFNNPIDRQSKENYEYLQKKCAKYIKSLNGRMYAKIDDEKYQASITLYHSFFEFVDKKDLKFLKNISKRCNTMTFSIEKEEIKIVMLIYYFRYAYEEIKEVTEHYNMIQKERGFEI